MKRYAHTDIKTKKNKGRRAKFRSYIIALFNTTSISIIIVNSGYIAFYYTFSNVYRRGSTRVQMHKTPYNVFLFFYKCILIYRKAVFLQNLVQMSYWELGFIVGWIIYFHWEDKLLERLKTYQIRHRVF